MSEAPADQTPDQTTPAEPEPVAPKGRTKAKIGAAIGIGVLLIAVIAFFGLRGNSETLTVNFALLDADSSCAGGTGGYDDVGPGMDVVVRDKDSRVIATGSLGDGDDLDGVGCVWTAVLDDVPGGEDYYEVSVGDRGEQVYSADEMAEKEWTLELTLGG